MARIDEVAGLMSAVLERVQRCNSLHLIGRLSTEFPLGAGVFPMFFRLAVRLEAWYRSPQWRFEASYAGRQWVSVIVEPSNYIYELRSEGKWIRRKSIIGIRPDEVKLRFFGLNLLDTVAFVTLSETSWYGKRAWKVEGEEAGGRSAMWLIDVDDPEVREFVDNGSFFDFEYEGKRKRVQLPVTTVVEYELVEFPAELPSELFEVPPDASIEEPLMDKLWERFERWLAAQ